MHRLTEVLHASCVRFIVPVTCINYVLSNLRGIFANTPTDFKELMNSRRTTQLKEVSPGCYCHIRIHAGLCVLPRNPEIVNASIIGLQLNTGGLHHSGSSDTLLWTILVGVAHRVTTTPILVCVRRSETTLGRA